MSFCEEYGAFKHILCNLNTQDSMETFLLALKPANFKLFICKKGKRKVQGVPQSQTAVLPRPQEEEETDKSKQAQTEQTHEKH